MAPLKPISHPLAGFLKAHPLFAEHATALITGTVACAILLVFCGYLVISHFIRGAEYAPCPSHFFPSTAWADVDRQRPDPLTGKRPRKEGSAVIATSHVSSEIDTEIEAEGERTPLLPRFNTDITPPLSKGEGKVARPLSYAGTQTRPPTHPHYISLPGTYIQPSLPGPSSSAQEASSPGQSPTRRLGVQIMDLDLQKLEMLRQKEKEKAKAEREGKVDGEGGEGEGAAREEITAEEEEFRLRRMAARAEALTGAEDCVGYAW